MIFGKVNVRLFFGDITTLQVDAIVNSANRSLLAGGGVCGAIHRKAGPQLEQECRKIGSCGVGEAVITKAYQLPAKYVIHTVGPIWGQNNGRDAELLAQCYTESLQLAEKYQLSSIAFPSISTGIHRFPVERAAKIVAQTFYDYIYAPKNSLEMIALIAHDKNTYDEYESIFIEYKLIKPVGDNVKKRGYMMEHVESWYKSQKPWVRAVLFLLFMPVGLTVLINKQKSWKKQNRNILILVVWVVFGIMVIREGAASKPASLSQVQEQVAVKQEEKKEEAAPPEAKQTPPPTPRATPSPTPKPTPTLAPTQKATPSPTPTPEPKSSLDRIQEIVEEKTGGSAELTIWHGDEFATEKTKPYNVVVNFPFDNNFKRCGDAKNISYEVVKSLYMDTLVRNSLQRVLVSIPYFLRTSVGASDGIELANNNSFSGPTNYWEVMSSPQFSSEDETGKLENRTWGILLGRCE